MESKERWISKSQFKARALELFREVEASGESLIVTDHGRPLIEVRRYTPTEPDPLATLKGTVLEYREPLEPVGTDEWEATR